jgi:hypothetical protein
MPFQILDGGLSTSHRGGNIVVRTIHRGDVTAEGDQRVGIGRPDRLTKSSIRAFVIRK